MCPPATFIYICERSVLQGCVAAIWLLQSFGHLGLIPFFHVWLYMYVTIIFDTLFSECFRETVIREASSIRFRNLGCWSCLKEIKTDVPTFTSPKYQMPLLYLLFGWLWVFPIIKPLTAPIALSHYFGSCVFMYICICICLLLVYLYHGKRRRHSSSSKMIKKNIYYDSTTIGDQ